MTTAVPMLGAQMATAVEAIRKRTAFVPEVGMILGTGLGALGKSINIEAEIPYAGIPGFPASTVESHAGFIRDETLARELDVGGRAARPDLEQQVDLDGVAAVIGVQRHGAD